MYWLGNVLLLMVKINYYSECLDLVISNGHCSLSGFCIYISKDSRRLIYLTLDYYQPVFCVIDDFIISSTTPILAFEKLSKCPIREENYFLTI
jgi:hypothetical protein